jgi:hypothetical protein
MKKLPKIILLIILVLIIVLSLIFILNKNNNQTTQNKNNEQINQNIDHFDFVLSEDFNDLCDYSKHALAVSQGYAWNYFDNNKNCPSFYLISKDFKAEGMNFIDNILFEDDIPHYMFNNEKYEEVIEIEKNIFQIISYSDYECSLSIDAKLVYKFPEDSKYKYTMFHLKSATPFTRKDHEDVCAIKKDIITKKLQELKNDENVNDKLNIALDIINLKKK